MMKIIAALLVAPLFPAVVAALLVGMLGTQFNAENAWAAAFSCLLGGYVAVLFIGFPLFFVWKHFGWTQVIGGVTLGIVSAVGVTFAVVLLLRSLRHTDVSFLTGLMNLLILTMPLGGVGGLAFWWFGLRRAVAVRPQ